MKNIASALYAAWSLADPPAFDRKPHWLSFDASRGMFVCKGLGTERDGLLAVIAAFRPIRLLTGQDGRVVCAADDRRAASYGRVGQDCNACADRNEGCNIRWRIWLNSPDDGHLFAHTLSLTGSINFERYAWHLQEENRMPEEVLTELSAETFTIRTSGHTYRCVQFKRADA